jgi:hypothetical protein
MPKRENSQIAKFKQAARELETDNDEKRFNEKLEAIARRKPSDRRATKPPKKDA